MIVPQRDVQGGIASVTSGYYGSRLETDFDVIYVESYRDGSKWQKLLKALAAYRQFRPEDAVHPDGGAGRDPGGEPHPRLGDG